MHGTGCAARARHATIPDDARVVVFDCDGVLIDSWDSIISIYNCILADLGFAPLKQEIQRTCFIGSWRDGFALAMDGANVERAMERLRSFDYSRVSGLIHVMPGIDDLLARLAASGRKLAVNTNGASEQRQILARVDLLKHFDIVVTADDVTHPKPNPSGALSILAAFEAEPDDALFIGDSSNDQKAADNAGIPFWAYNNPRLCADEHITDFALVEVPPLV
ncbi:HAD superfamily hydrolase (TIGR01509 family) [Desulfobaculum xiamenense]|uniref:phosphoglycolate phosphatase n=1 Tax=Desulfobaculum xiamenense TaxID=995050 RepID=A0A846QUB7_9BACT|nr:HAD-IA family hydrolase [Desulfobaculum xiamenense]NJB68744.1 HAD superfamily hydrolase (TIGR01509 family) [Desulfobaculum xiamenense]